jgi:hypothetical protein
MYYLCYYVPKNDDSARIDHVTMILYGLHTYEKSEVVIPRSWLIRYFICLLFYKIARLYKFYCIFHYI